MSKKPAKGKMKMPMKGKKSCWFLSSQV
jgi:hypothetical protein